MKEIIDKISSYNFFNYLLPGIVFAFIMREFTKIDITNNELVYSMFIYYFIGMIISRIGSIIIEPVFKKIKILKFSDYKDFVEASRNDSKIELFSEVNNTYRTITSIGFSLLLLKLVLFIFEIIEVSEDLQKLVGVIFLFFLFSFSYRKQTNYITKRIETAKNKNNGT